MKQQSIMEDSGMGNVPDDHKTDETVRSISADCLAASASPRGLEPSGSADSGPKDSSETAGRVAGSAVLARLRSSRSTVRICSIIGVLCAAVIVLLWFPHGAAAWTNPLQQIDAPAHYYFIRKILDEGIGAATHLWPNDEYYPPLFHLMAAGLISLAKVFGIDVSIYTAFNVVWLFTSALIWPIRFFFPPPYRQGLLDFRVHRARAARPCHSVPRRGLRLSSVPDAGLRPADRIWSGDDAAAVLVVCHASIL